MKYNYKTAIREDLRKVYENEIISRLFAGESTDEVYEWLTEEAFIDDSITGNASGSYTCNRWLAEEYIAHNLDIVSQVIYEWGYNVDRNGIEAESIDVMIRCFLLDSVAIDLIRECKEELDSWYEENIDK